MQHDANALPLLVLLLAFVAGLVLAVSVARRHIRGALGLAGGSTGRDRAGMGGDRPGHAPPTELDVTASRQKNTRSGEQADVCPQDQRQAGNGHCCRLRPGTRRVGSRQRGYQARHRTASPAPTPSEPPSSASAPTPSSGWTTSSPPTTTPTAPVRNWANFDACVGKDVGGTGANPDGSGFPCGADNTGTKAGVKRDEGVVDPAAAGGSLPSGSGDGRTLLRNPADKLFSDVAYGRSSGPINTTDLAAGEIALPFAVDKIVVATHPGGPAPASLTGPQILKIYNGTYTNWNQVGGKNAQIHAYMPKAGSSTLNAFVSFLAGAGRRQTRLRVPTTTRPRTPPRRRPGRVGRAPAITDANWNTGWVTPRTSRSTTRRS